MKKLKYLWLNKRGKILSISTLTLLLLLALLPLGLWVRYQFFLLNGGLSESYIDWAFIHYFGGITPQYVQGADDILHLRPFSTTSYPPGYSIFIAIWKLFGINNLQTIRLIQAAIDCLTVFPIFYVLNRLGVRPIFSLCAAGIYIVAPLWAFGSVMLLAESLSPAMMAWLLALMVFASSRRQKILWVAAGLIVALMALIRPDLILFLCPLLLWTIFTAPNDQRIQAVTMTIIGFFIPIFLWGAYNKINHGQWLFTSNSGSYALWGGLGQLPNDYGYFVNDAKARELLTKQGIISWHSAESSNYWRTAYYNAWRQHPIYVLRVILYRISKIPFDHQLYRATVGYFEGLHTYFTKYGFFVLCLSLVPLIFQKKFSTAYLISLPLVYALASLGLVYYEPRYIRYVPLSYIFAGAIELNLLYSGFVSLSPLLRKRAVSLGLVVLVLTVIGSYTTRNMLVLSEEAKNTVLANQTRLAFAQDRTKPIATLSNLTWTKAVDDVSFETDSAGHLHVKTSQGQFNYQLMTRINTSGFSSILINYDVHVEDSSGMAVGLLSPNQSHFIGTTNLNTPGDHVDFLTVPVKDLQSMWLVLMNSRSENGQSRFEVRKLDIVAM